MKIFCVYPRSVYIKENQFLEEVNDSPLLSCEKIWYVQTSWTIVIKCDCGCLENIISSQPVEIDKNGRVLPSLENYIKVFNSTSNYCCENFRNTILKLINQQTNSAQKDSL